MGRRRPAEPWDGPGASGKRRSLASAIFPSRANPADRSYPAYPQDDPEDEADYYDEAAHTGQPDDDPPSIPFAPLLTLPTLPAVQAPPAQQRSAQRDRRRPRRWADQAPNENDEDEWSWQDADDARLPASSSPGASSPRQRDAARAMPLAPGRVSAPPAVDAPPRRGRWGQPAPQSQPPTSSGKHRKLPVMDPDALPEIMPLASNPLTPVRASTSAPLAPRKPNRSRALESLDVVLIPGRNLTRRLIPQPVRRRLARPTIRTLEFIQRRRVALIALLVVALATGLLVNVTGLGRAASLLNVSAWRASAGATPLPTPLIAPDTLDAGHYVNKYGFDWPSNPQALPGDEWNRLVYMLPFAILGANAADRKYNATIEPEMVVWWTHAEGIGGRINYSNCANQGTRPGTNYFTDIENCNQSSFWQLGYGNQFSVIYVLKDAFTALYGDPNNTRLVQKVGQGVLNYDASQGTVPQCGGYSCTFPAMTIDQIVSGINEDTGMVTADNWWASVLSRDPAINCYMIAYALEFFNHAATRNWVGCYYYEPCWGYESNRLGDILAAWPGLRKAAGL